MKRLAPLVLMVLVATAHAQTAKKDLVQKLLKLQQPAIEALAREIASRPAMQMAQAVGNVLQTQVPPDKREAAGKSIDADLKKYVDEATPVMRDRAIKLAPSTYGAMLEEKFSEDELKQLVKWFESPINRKYQQLAPEMQSAFIQKLVADVTPVLDPKLQAVQQKVRATLSATGEPPSAASGAAPAPKASAK